MCTITVLKQKDGSVHVTFNRDERIFLKEIVPTLSRARNVAIVSPKDVKSDGSWIGANEFGVMSSLLNRYDEVDDGDRKSRGEITSLLLGKGKLKDIISFLERDFDAQQFKPFTVIALDKKQLVEFNFDGKSTSINLNVIDEPFMRSSSSWRAKEVITFRENLFELWLKNQNYSHNMPDFNLPNGNEDEYWTPFVKREKVHTKNICHVELKNDYVDFKYYPFEQIIKNNKILSCEHLNLKINN